MSLREQLLKKGLVDAKRARQIDRESKRERKEQQAQRDKKKVAEARARAEQEAEVQASVEARAVARREAEIARERAALPARIRQKVLANQIRGRGPVPFYVTDLDGVTLRRVDVPHAVAWRLRAGEAAVAALVKAEGESDLVVINAQAARDLMDFAPEVVRFFVTDVQGISATELAFQEPKSEVDLRPRRATEEEIAAFRKLGGIKAASG